MSHAYPVGAQNRQVSKTDGHDVFPAHCVGPTVLTRIFPEISDIFYIVDCTCSFILYTYPTI